MTASWWSKDISKIPDSYLRYSHLLDIPHIPCCPKNVNWIPGSKASDAENSKPNSLQSATPTPCVGYTHRFFKTRLRLHFSNWSQTWFCSCSVSLPTEYTLPSSPKHHLRHFHCVNFPHGDLQTTHNVANKEQLSDLVLEYMLTAVHLVGSSKQKDLWQNSRKALWYDGCVCPCTRCYWVWTMTTLSPLKQAPLQKIYNNYECLHSIPIKISLMVDWSTAGYNSTQVQIGSWKLVEWPNVLFGLSSFLYLQDSVLHSWRKIIFNITHGLMFLVAVLTCCSLSAAGRGMWWGSARSQNQLDWVVIFNSSRSRAMFEERRYAGYEVSGSNFGEGYDFRNSAHSPRWLADELLLASGHSNPQINRWGRDKILCFIRSHRRSAKHESQGAHSAGILRRAVHQCHSEGSAPSQAKE